MCLGPSFLLRSFTRRVEGGWRLHGGTAGGCTAHLDITTYVHERVLLQTPGHSTFCPGLPDAGFKGQAGASWAGI